MNSFIKLNPIYCLSVDMASGVTNEPAIKLFLDAGEVKVMEALPITV